MAMQAAGRRVALAVGIILVAVSVVAIISIAKQRSEAVRHQEMTQIAKEQHESQAEDKKSQEAAQQEAAKREADKKAEEQKAQEVAAQQEAERRSAAEASVGELPQTGVGGLWAVIPVGVTTFTIAAYAGSRRHA